jgi:hypothetical protein
MCLCGGGGGGGRYNARRAGRSACDVPWQARGVVPRGGGGPPWWCCVVLRRVRVRVGSCRCVLVGGALFEPLPPPRQCGAQLRYSALGGPNRFFAARQRDLLRRSLQTAHGTRSSRSSTRCASPGTDVGESRRRRGRVTAQTWASPGVDVGESRRRCGRVPAQTWVSPGADVGRSCRSTCSARATGSSGTGATTTTGRSRCTAARQH